VRLSDNAARHLVAEFALGKKCVIPFLNARTAVVNWPLGQTQFVGRNLLPGPRPTRVVAFIVRTASMSAGKNTDALPYCMRDDTTLATRVNRAYITVAGETFPQRYLNSSQAVAPGSWGNVDVGACYNSYRKIAHKDDAVLGERDFYGRMLFCFDTSASGSSGETMYDPSEDTSIDVTIDFAAATASALSLVVVSYTPRTIEIDAARTVTRL